MTTDRLSISKRSAAVSPCRSRLPHLIVPGFILEEAQPGIEEDYPPIAHPGSFPLPSLQYGPRFKALIEALTGPDMTALVEDKLGIDLSGRPITVTVRGVSRASDGQIHTDSKSKLVTMLLYMNREWESSHGRLRLLRSRNIHRLCGRGAARSRHAAAVPQRSERLARLRTVRRPAPRDPGELGHR